MARQAASAPESVVVYLTLWDNAERLISKESATASFPSVVLTIKSTSLFSLNIKYKLSRILKEYPEDFNNNKKCSNNYLFLNNIINLTKTFFKLNNNYILYLENNINKLNKDRDDFQNDLKENINELIDFEETIEKYWKPRVDKLRNKCITKNKYIKYFKILLVTSNTITFVITIYLIKKNIYFI